ncbi:MAG: 30S ribosomal protein S8 [Gemmatimonadota bacterium]|jgi:small subunit ribosomal protein S8|nr:MAG: 30S ribosomal protein S8 [Gemmatimonadota bacterium]
MSLNDPVADMLTRIRNAGQAGQRRVDMPVSKLRMEIARILVENHFIHEYKVLDDGDHGVLRLYLKYTEDGRPVIRLLQRESRPGLRRYVKASEVPRVLSGMGIAILSTSQGVMTDRDARAARVGGELLATVY